MGNLNRLWQAEIMLTNDITIGDDAVVLSANFLGINGCNVPSIIVIHAVETVLRVIVQFVHTLIISNEQYDIYLEPIGVIDIHIFIAIDHTNPFIAKPYISNAELPVDVGICSGKQIMDRIAVNRLTKSIENLRCQFELLYLQDQAIVLILRLKLLHIIANHFSDLCLNFTNSRSVQPGHGEQMRHAIQ